MSVNVEIPVALSVANGVTTTFPHAFTVLSPADLTVQGELNGVITTYTLGTHYTLTGVGTNSGSVIFGTVPASGTIVKRFRNMSLSRATDYQDNGDLLAKTLDDDFDRLWLAMQEILYGAKGAPSAVRAPAGETVTELPAASGRAGYLLGFDGAGNPIMVPGQSGTASALALDLASGADGKGAAMVGFRQSGVGAVWRSVYDELRTQITPYQFGAINGGIVDATDALQAAIDSLGSNPGVINLPPGRFRITRKVRVRHNRQHIIGAGSWATQILFAPTASGSCIELNAGGSVLFQGSVKGISFYSDDSTYTKTAIEMVDTSGYLIDDIVVGGGVEAVSGSYFWAGNGSRGIWTRGREACKLSRLYIYADKPIQISANPNNSISCDHFHFEDTYLGASGACVTIDSGVNVTHLTFDGYNPWVLGTDGLYWVDTTSVGVSQSVSLKNIRWEQGTNASSWCLRIEHNVGLQGLTIENCQADQHRHGYKLRKCVGVEIITNISAATDKVVLDVDSSVLGLNLDECYWNVGATASMVGQHVVMASPKRASGDPLPPSARYQSTATSSGTGRQLETEMAQGGYQITVANSGTFGLGPNTMAGVLTLVDSEGISAQFLIRGTNQTTNEALDPVNVFSASAGTASSTNVYWSAANSRYELQNLRGASRNYKIVFTGTYTSF
jgi:hypothetical protein